MRVDELLIDRFDLREARANAHRLEQFRKRGLCSFGDELDALTVVAVTDPAREAARYGLAADKLPEAHALDLAGDHGLEPFHPLPPCAIAGRGPAVSAPASSIRSSHASCYPRAMRVVFMGSPEFALPSLRRLIESAHDIVGVFTQPDRPSGRGRMLAPPPVKELALEQGLPVFQPSSVRAPDTVAQLHELAPDVGVIAAYGQILRQVVLDVPPLGILNVHASLLPRWRGAAPIPAPPPAR